MEKYIHYGSNKYDRNQFVDIKNIEYKNKPFGGLWASRINARYGWEKWCRDNDFNIERLDQYFIFNVKNGAKILEIHSIHDLKNIPRLNYNDLFKVNFYPDFEKIKEQGYDAIELFLSDDHGYTDITESLYFRLYGWDCDSILILNPDIICVI